MKLMSATKTQVKMLVNKNTSVVAYTLCSVLTTVATSARNTGYNNALDVI